MKKFLSNLKQAYPKGTAGIIVAALVVVALVGSVFVYRAASNFVAQMTIVNLPGAPVVREPTATPEGAIVDPVAPTATMVPLDTFELPEPWDGKTRVNLLIMGLDARTIDASFVLTDTMILFSLDPLNNTAAMLSIPRDLWVKIPGGNYGKINTAYGLGEQWQLPGGGPALATKAVENLLGVKIDYYAQVDFNTFVKFIDAIGGVKIDVPERVQLNIVNTQFSQWLDPGVVTLPGDLALAYVRYREPTGGDITRSRRQQAVIMAVRDRVLEFDMLPTLVQRAPQMYQDFSDGVHTNLDLAQILRLAVKFFNDIPRDQILSRAINYDYAVPATSPDGLAILRPMPDRIRELRDEIFTGGTFIDASTDLADVQAVLAAEGARVSVRNGSSTAGLAERMTAFLQGQGVNVVETIDTSYTTYSSLTFYGAKPYTIGYLVDTVGIINNSYIIYAFDQSASVDIVLVLGDDYAGSNTLP